MNIHSLYEYYLPNSLRPDAFSIQAHIHYAKILEQTVVNIQAELGLLSKEAAKEICSLLDSCNVDIEKLKQALATDGIPSIELVRQWKSCLPEPLKPYLHLGLTSQDVWDTACICVLRDESKHLKQALYQLLQHLQKEVERHTNQPCFARTRWRKAQPMSLGVKIAQWAMPLIDWLRVLESTEKQLYSVQLGGIDGRLGSMQQQAWTLLKQVAEKMNLHPRLAWHNQRFSIQSYMDHLHQLGGILLKMSQDLLYLASIDPPEVLLKQSGGSSAMLYKKNPVALESLVAQAQLLYQQRAYSVSLHQRDGIGLAQEWIELPRLNMLAESLLRQTQKLWIQIDFDTDMIQQQIDHPQAPYLLAQAEDVLKKHGVPQTREQLKAISESSQPYLEHIKQHFNDPRFEWDKQLGWHPQRGLDPQIIQAFLAFNP